MKAVLVMFDSLNRHMLPPYGCSWVRAPHFRRLARHTVTFDNAYVGSMPCMPARRELHTGRYNFLHRSWGPLEPFDDSMPEILKKNGVYTHLTSDHYHYWEEGGCNYHTRYSSWDVHRGQEGDPWKADLTDRVSLHPGSLNNKYRKGEWMRHDWMNRHYMRRERDWPQAKTFAAGLEFLAVNHAEDRWFLQIETFDPHEPYFACAEYRRLYPHRYDGPHFDWPPYAPTTSEHRQYVEHILCENAALVSMCDRHLGKVLDAMDRYDLWKDTLLIVTTDHGFLLGEHDWWGKCVMPFYNEIARIPLFVWDPRCRKKAIHRQSLVQTVDLAPTLLEFFGVKIPPDMQGLPLRRTVAEDRPVREAGLFGVFGGHVNVTDGRYVYMRGPARPANGPLFEYTLMPTHMRRTFEVAELQKIRLAPSFPFTKGCRTMKIRGHTWKNPYEFGTLLFDLAADPKQETPIRNPRVEARMVRHLVREMKRNHAPREQFARLGLRPP